MLVKKFEAKNVNEALKMVKQELGPDAIILASKERQKAYGLGGEKSIEVTAAISEQKYQERKLALSRLQDSTKKKIMDSSASVEKKFIERSVARYRNDEEQILQEIEAQNQAKQNLRNKARNPQQAANRGRRYIDIESDDVEEQNFSPAAQRRQHPQNRNPNHANTTAMQARQMQMTQNSSQQNIQGQNSNDYLKMGRQSQLQQARNLSNQDNYSQSNENIAQQRVQQAAMRARQSFPQEQQAVNANNHINQNIHNSLNTALNTALSSNAQSEAEVAQLREEIAKLNHIIANFKPMPQTFITSHPGASNGISFELSFMYETLMQAGISEEHSVQILKKCAQELELPQQKKRSLVNAWVAKHIMEDCREVGDKNHPHLQVFIGPSASGKTSSLIKYASRLVIEKRKSVAVVSTDIQKVGGIEQMKIFTQILNIPFAVVRKKEDWPEILKILSGIDVILVDMPGLSLKDLSEIQILKDSLPPASENPVIHYVQNITAKDATAMEIARRYKMFHFSDIVFTALDEATQHGLIYNMQKDFAVPMHSFGIGQNIPEDLEMATRERLIDLIFQISKLKRGM